MTVSGHDFFLAQALQPEPSLLQNLSNIGTFVASMASIALVIFALVQLSLLRRQVKLAQSQTEAATKAITESARTRADDQAPRVLVLMEAPQWPPFVDRHRSRMPGAGEPSLLETLGQSEPAGGEPYVFDEQRDWFLWFRTRGVLLNEGRGTARVRLDHARFIVGQSELIGDERDIPLPPRVGAPSRREYLLRPGDVALFEWAYGHPLHEWADAQERPHPPNPHGAGFLIIVAFDWLSSGTIDHMHVTLTARPIEPVPNRQGQWTLTTAQGADLDFISYPPTRTYRVERELPPSPPWAETFAEWDKQHQS